jgi:UDP-glucose:(heptosyl)LPS alpha-1,3-glucosyltransferase
VKIALAHKRLDLSGGTESDFYRTAEALRDRGHEVHLFCGDFRVKPPPGTRAHRVVAWPVGRTPSLLSFAYSAPKAAARHGCDLLVGFGRLAAQDVLRCGGGTHRSFLARMAAEESAARRLWHRWSPYHRAVLALEARQFRPAAYRKIVAVSREVKREIVSLYGVPEEKIAVIYNGVDAARFHPRRRATSRRALRARLGIPDHAPLLLFVGNGFRRKGLDRLLAAWRGRAMEGLYLLVVGEDQNEKRYREAAGRIARDSIRFAGRQDGVEDFYAAADLLVLPALQEAFGNVVLEALASGLPVVVSAAVGAAELLEGELREGIVGRPDDPEELRAAIGRMLEPARLEALRGRAREIGEKHTWDAHFDRLEQVLRETLEVG